MAVNVAVFALELPWGGSDSALTLYRMGPASGALVSHEPWRLVSAAFLHVNVLHLSLNMWALFVLGRMLESVLGSRRFVVLYALSAAAGGLASAVVHPQILSAGASGAVWGLMTAQVAMVLRLRRQEGAERMPVPMTRLLWPLVVNFLISLIPGIDTAAHLRGGAGAGLVLSGIIEWRRPEVATWRPAAWGASLAMAACLVAALCSGRPWESASRPRCLLQPGQRPPYRGRPRRGARGLHGGHPPEADPVLAYNNRGIARGAKGDLDGALADYSEAVRLKSVDPDAYYNRALLWRRKQGYRAAIADFEKYLQLGGGQRDGDQAEVEGMIRDLKRRQP